MHSGIARPSRPTRQGTPARRLLRILITATILTSFAAVLPAPQTARADHATGGAQYAVTAMTSQAQSAEVGTTFGEEVGVRVRHNAAPGDPFVDGVVVRFTATASEDGASGTFPNGTNTVDVTSTSVNDLPGFAFAPPFTANDIAGQYIIDARVVVDGEFAVPNAFSMTNTDGSANKAHSISTGDGSLQAAVLNTTYASAFNAIVFNGNNQLMGGVTVVFTAPATGPSGTFAGGSNVVTVTTNGNGVATTPSFTANGTQGGYSVVASVSGDQTTTGDEITTPFSVRNSTTEVLGVPETVSASAGNFQEVGVQTTLPINLQVAVLDGSLALVSGATVTFTLPDTDTEASGLFSNGTRTSTTTTGSNGLATALPLTTNDIVGTISVAVTATKNDVTASTNMLVVNGRVMTSTTLSIDPTNGSVYGQPVTVSATVEPLEGSLVPEGPVNFFRDGNPIVSCTGVTPVNGVATCEQNWLEPGTYTYTADYHGDLVSLESSSDPLDHTVTKADTSIDMTSSHPTFALEGEAVTITATVNPVPPGAAQPGEPTGTVSFTSSDGTLLNNGDPVALVNGVATVTTSDLSVGIHTITATYGGDSHFFGSSNTMEQHVYKIPEVTDDPDDMLVLLGNQATFTAAADGFPEPDVQWQVSTDNGQTFEDIPGADSTTYTFTPTIDDDGNQYQAVFTNVAGGDTSLPATLTVRQPPSITSADATTFTVGVAGSFTITFDGYLPPTLSFTGPLPDGVTLDTDTGLLSGTPAEETGGVYPLVLTAANGTEPDAVQNFTLTVNESPEFTSVDNATFDVGIDQSFSVTASGYPSPTFSTTDPLPLGVTLSSDGELGGVPMEGGVFTIEITATNGIDPDVTQTFTLTVNKAEQEPLVITGPAIGEYGQILDITSTGGSGTGALTFSVTVESTACAIVDSGPDVGKLEILDSSGTCVLIGTKEGDTFYLDTTSAPFVVTVTRATTTLVAVDAVGVFDGTTTLSATLTAQSGPLAGKTINFTINGTPVGSATTDATGQATLADVSLAGINAGSYPGGVEATFDGDDLYAGSSDDANLDISKAAGSVSISNLPLITKIGRSFVPAYDALGDGVTSVASLTPLICTVSGGTVSFDAEGTCELQASITEGTNHLAATGVIQSVPVVPNVPPEITSFTGPTGPVQLSMAVTVNASFTDGNTFDTHTATIDWGDGMVTNATITGGNGAWDASGSHIYTAAGEFVITITVTDDDNASDSMTLVGNVIIYEGICVSTHNGTVMGSSNGSCGSGQVVVSPVGQTFCIDSWTGRVYYLFGTACGPYQVPHVMPNHGDLLTCVSVFTNVNRRVQNHSQCSIHERPNVILALGEAQPPRRR